MGQIIYYKVGQSLLPSGVSIIKWCNFITIWGRYYKVEQLLHSKWRPMLTDRAMWFENVVLYDKISFRWLKRF